MPFADMLRFRYAACRHTTSYHDAAAAADIIDFQPPDYLRHYDAAASFDLPFFRCRHFSAAPFAAISCLIF